nr:MAG TPA: hypothetical protein [Caudoviricetes sp.]
MSTLKVNFCFTTITNRDMLWLSKHQRGNSNGKITRKHHCAT